MWTNTEYSNCYFLSELQLQSSFDGNLKIFWHVHVYMEFEYFCPPPFFVINDLTINLTWSYVTAFCHLVRSSHQRLSVLCKKVFLKLSQIPQENTSVGVSFLTEDLQLFWKRDSNTGFSCEYCEISKSTYFEEHLKRMLLYHMWGL